jgi:ketosteroid isomerase-like protein
MGNLLQQMYMVMEKEFVTEEGFWQSFDANNAMFDNGKFLVLWKKTPDGWKMFRDSFSSDNKK